MNAIVKFQFGAVVTQACTFRGRPCMVGPDLGAALEYTTNTFTRSTGRWQSDGELVEGDDFEVLRGQDLADFKALLEANGARPFGPRVSNLTIFYESGIWQVCQLSEKPAGKALRRTLSTEVLPKLARGESIEATPKPAAVADPERPRVLSEAEVKAGMAAVEFALKTKQIGESEAAVHLARLIQGKIDLFTLPEGVGFQRALPTDASQALADGRPVLVLPVADVSGLRNASQIGEPHGLSGQAVNDIAKELGVHGDERLGRWRNMLTDDGRVKNRYFSYNADGVAAIETRVAEVGAAKRAEAEAKARRSARQPDLPLR